MANSLLTTSKITREAVMLFINSNLFLRNIDRQYDADFGKAGEKIGSQLRIRLPNDYTVRKGQAAAVQDTAEQQTVLTMATQAGVDLSFATADLYLSLDDFSERVLKPAMNVLAGQVAVDVMTAAAETGFVSASSGISAPLSATTGGACNLVSNVSGGNIISPTITQFLEAKAALNDNSAPDGTRCIVQDPWTEARTVSSLSGLLNPASRISKQYESGEMKNAVGFDWYMDQTVIKHTTGTFSAGTVNGANQTGNTLVVNAITGTLVVGDIIAIAGVNAVNRVTKQSTGTLRQFVVTAAAASGATSISIYPAITPPSGGNAVQYQTVTASPANTAAISLATPASSTYRKNLAYSPKAITMATGDLPIPRGSVEGARAKYDGVSMRLVTQYAIGTDQDITRSDILYGALVTRPEWCVVVADAL